MAVTAYKYPNVAAQDNSVGTPTNGQWYYLDRIKLADSQLAVHGVYGLSGGWKITNAKLIVGGAIVGTNIAAAGIAANTATTIGGAANTWGNTLTGADVSSDEFGVAISYTGYNAGGGGTAIGSTYYLVAKGFSLGLPAWAVIQGVEVYSNHVVNSTGGGTDQLQVDAIQLRVYYTADNKIIAGGDSSAFMYVEPLYPQDMPSKYRYAVSDKNFNYIGELGDNVINLPSIKSDINSLNSNLTVLLGQNENQTATDTSNLMTEDDYEITTEDDLSLLAELTTPMGIGDGTNADVNNNVELSVTYGAWVPLLTEDGYPILTEDDELILVTDGAPQGRTLFTGYASNWELDINSESVSMEHLSHSRQLDNIVFETPDTTQITSGAQGYDSIGIAGGGPYDYWSLAQTFTPASNVTINSVQFMTFGWVGATFGVTLVQGNPSSPGTTLGSGTGMITAQAYQQNPTASTVPLSTSGIALVAGTQYTLFIDTGNFKTGGNNLYPCNFLSTAASYASGQAYWATKSIGYTDAGMDIYFNLIKSGGATTVTINSTDPSVMLKRVIDFARSRGALVNYDASSIDPTGTTVSYTFNTQTIAETIETILKLCPSDWYYYYDPATNLIHLHKRPTAVTRQFVRGKDVISLKLKRSIEQLVNDVLFSGGGTPALYYRYTDQASINSLRRGLLKMSDQRVTVLSTAQILAQAQVNRNKNAVYSAQTSIVRADMPLEDINLGELVQHIGFSTLLAGIQLQIMSKTYKPDTMDFTLNVLLPSQNQRIEDIKRNLTELENQDNPATPST